MGSAATLTKQIADIQKQARDAMSFDVTATLATFDTTRAQQALEHRDLTELEGAMPKNLAPDAAALGALVAVVVLRILPTQLGASLGQIAATAVENAAETGRLILSATDAAYNTSSELRGLVILLGVLAAIKTLRE